MHQLPQTNLGSVVIVSYVFLDLDSHHQPLTPPMFNSWRETAHIIAYFVGLSSRNSNHYTAVTPSSANLDKVKLSFPGELNFYLKSTHFLHRTMRDPCRAVHLLACLYSPFSHQASLYQLGVSSNSKGQTMPGIDSCGRGPCPSP